MKKEIAKLLYENRGEYVSGEALSKMLGVSRTAIWKHMKALKEEGYAIETSPKKGYRIENNTDLVFPEEIKINLNTRCIAKEIIYFDSINSTNNYCKQIVNEAHNGTLVVSEEQTAGRGRVGRSWHSPKYKGIWMSLILKPKIPPMEGAKITQIAAASVCKAIQLTTDLNPLIKWPNDIVVNGKKTCGILTEMAGELNEINYLIVGIGINVNTHQLPQHLETTATSLFIEGNKEVDRKKLLSEILNVFEVLYDNYLETNTLQKTLEICRKYSAVLNKKIQIHQGKQIINAEAIDITNEGLLKVKLEDGQEKEIVAGEISIRGQSGYVPI